MRKQVDLREDELKRIKEENMSLHNELYPIMPHKGRSYEEMEEMSIGSASSEHSQQEGLIIEGISDSNTQRENNLLLQKVKRLKKEAPMTYSNVWKLFEIL
jgi:hypothetical protein